MESCSEQVSQTEEATHNQPPDLLPWPELHRGEKAAIDVDDLAVDEIGGGRGQEHGGAAQLVRMAPARGRGAALDEGVELRIVHQRAVQLGGEIAGADAV